MRASDTQVGFWDRAADAAEFTLPIDAARLAPLSRDAAILDFGCGYGRSLAELAERGYTRLCGVDASPRMIERARRRLPAADLRVCRGVPAPFPDASFDAALVVAVLTCLPEDDDQRALVGDLLRLLRPGGILVACDFLLQTDERNRARYATGAGARAPYGVFALEDGLRVRHHDADWIRSLFTPFDELAFETFTARTMRGHAATAFRFTGRAPQADLRA